MLSTIQTFDADALLWIQEYLRQPIADSFFVFYSQLGNAGILWIASSLMMMAFKKTRKAGFFALLSMLLGLLVTNFTLKLLIARERPWLNVEGLNPLLYSNDPNSFPSGHTCAAFAFAVSQCFSWKKWRIRILVLFAALLMGISRIYVGVHYPSDVLMGALVGGLCAYLIWLIWNRWLEHRRSIRKNS